MASKILGRSTMCMTPSTAMQANHTSVMGPKNLPMPAVPRFCTRNRHSRMTSVMGMMNRCSAGDMTSIPSTADSTEMAGVMTPSP